MDPTSFFFSTMAFLMREVLSETKLISGGHSRNRNWKRGLLCTILFSMITDLPSYRQLQDNVDKLEAEKESLVN